MSEENNQEEQEKTNYWKLVQKSLKLVWKNKLLWLLGIFAGFSGGGSVIFRMDGNRSHNQAMPWENASGINWLELMQTVTEWIDHYWVFLLVGIILLGIVALALMVISFVSLGALLFSAQRLHLGLQVDFKMAVREGWNKFLRIVLIRFWGGLIVFGAFLVILGPIIAFVVMERYWAAFAGGLIGISLFIFISIFVGLLVMLALLFGVLMDYKPLDALSKAYALFLEKKKEVILAFLVTWLASIVSGIFIILLLGAVTIGAAGLALLSSLLFKMGGLIASVVIGGVLILGAVFLAKGFVTAFIYTLWVLLFSELKGEKIDKEKVKKALVAGASPVATASKVK